MATLSRPTPIPSRGPQPVALVTGAAGLIGGYLLSTAAASAPGWRVEGLTRARLDLTNRDALRRLWQEVRPDLVIHCAALSKPRHCQADPGLARRLNVDVTGHLVDLARETRVVLLSTDQVFDGRRGGYTESDAVNPVTVYAETKVEAEGLVLADPRQTVIRTSLNAGWSAAGDRSFNEELHRAWVEGRSLRLFIDEFRCPIPAEVTARAVWELALHHPPGLYHVAGCERLSRWEIGRLLAAQWAHLSPRMEPASLAEFREFPRQPDLSLRCDKAQARLSFPLPAFSTWLADHASTLAGRAAGGS